MGIHTTSRLLTSPLAHRSTTLHVVISRGHRMLQIIRQRARNKEHGRPAGVKQKLACTQERKHTLLLDLPEGVIISILRCLPTQSKVQAERACKTFREVLGNPAPGSFVWDRVSLEDVAFQKPSVHVLHRGDLILPYHQHISTSGLNLLQCGLSCTPIKLHNMPGAGSVRWLLKRAQGIYILHHRGQLEKHKAYFKGLPDALKRDQQIALTTLPLVSGLLSPESSLHLDLSWVVARLLFAPERPGFESQFWNSLSTVLTHLELCIEEESLTEGTSTALCQLTRLQRLRLNSSADTSARTGFGMIKLDLPLLQHLTIESLNFEAIHLKCPQMGELLLYNMSVRSFSGMPNGVQKVHLSMDHAREWVPFQVFLPAHSTTSLEELVIVGDGPQFTDPEAVKTLCLNGKMRGLRMDSAAAHAGAFSMNASWQAVPRTLQEVSLSLPLDEGIPRILEQLPNLTSLALNHSGQCRMHLDRPLDPFIDMPRLKELELQSSWNKHMMDGTNVCMWTPPALKLLGLADKRIMQMRVTSPGRSITLIY